MPNNTIEQIDKIKAIIQELLDQIAPSGRISARLESNSDGEHIIFNIVLPESEQPSILIGQRGNNLLALQHLARTLVRHKLNENIEFALDVNDYFRSRHQYLTDLAQRLAKQVAQTKRPTSLGPMTAFERRLIHMALANDPRVVTESKGEGERRQVVIKLRD